MKKRILTLAVVILAGSAFAAEPVKQSICPFSWTDYGKLKAVKNGDSTAGVVDSAKSWLTAKALSIGNPLVACVKSRCGNDAKCAQQEVNKAMRKWVYNKIKDAPFFTLRPADWLLWIMLTTTFILIWREKKWRGHWMICLVWGYLLVTPVRMLDSTVLWWIEGIGVAVIVVLTRKSLREIPKGGPVLAGKPSFRQKPQGN